MWRSGLISILFLLLSLGAIGQSTTQEALKHYKKKELEEARRLIDSAITLEKQKERAFTWQIRGFIYKDLFKEADEPDRSDRRNTAIESFRKALERDPSDRTKEQSRKSMRFLAKTCYNDAIRRLDTSRIEGPVNLFERYVSVMMELGKDTSDLKKDIINFQNSLGVVHMDIYDSKRGHRQKPFDKAIEAFGEVLELDSSNYLANYNSGIMYYNWGVTISQRIDPSQMDVELRKVKQMQDKAAKRFKKALPFMKEAHQQRPKRLETLEGLSGIYYSLNEDERSKHYKQLKQKIIKERNR